MQCWPDSRERSNWLQDESERGFEAFLGIGDPSEALGIRFVKSQNFQKMRPKCGPPLNFGAMWRGVPMSPVNIGSHATVQELDRRK